jgi:type IV pilus assembly protein PilM
MLFTKKKEFVGVDVGSSSIKLVQLKEAKGGTYQLACCGMIPLPAEAIVDNTIMDSASVAEAIRNIIKSSKVKASDAVCSIGGNSVIIRKISVPTMTSEELEDQIQWEAEQYIPFDINDVNVDFQVLDTDERDTSRMNILLVASKKDMINDYTTVFAEAGLPLAIMDIDAFAIQNAFEFNYDPSPAMVVALVNIGAAMTNINIVQGGISLFTRDVQAGGNQFTEEIQKLFSVSSVEAEQMKLSTDLRQEPRLQGVLSKLIDALALEVRRSLEFYNSTATDGKIEAIYLSGGAALIPDLATVFAERLEVPVEVMNPFKKVVIGDKDFDPTAIQQMAPTMVVAAGLAIRRHGDK